MARLLEHIDAAEQRLRPEEGVLSRDTAEAVLATRERFLEADRDAPERGDPAGVAKLLRARRAYHHAIREAEVEVGLGELPSAPRDARTGEATLEPARR